MKLIQTRRVFLALLIFPWVLFSQVTNAPCNQIGGTPFTLNNFDNLSVKRGGGIWAGSNQTVIDSDTNNYANLGGFLGVSGWLRVTDNNDVYPAGTYAGFKVNLVNVSIGNIGTIKVSTWRNNQLLQVQQITEGNIIEVDGKKRIGFIADQEFDAVQVAFDGAALGLPNLQVYHAIIGRMCPGSEPKCNEFTALHNPDHPVFVNNSLTGVGGVTLSATTKAENLLTPNQNDHANLTNLSGIASSAYLTIENAIQTYPAGTFAGFEIQNANVIGLEILSNFDVITFNNGEQQEIRRGKALLVSAPLFDIGDRKIIGFETTKPFDAIQIRRNQPIGTMLGSTEVYNVVVKKPCEGPAFNCNTPTKITEPDFPVNISLENTGVEGVGCVSCSVRGQEHILDSNNDNYATINLPAGIGVSGSLSVKKSLTPWNAGTFAGFEIANANLSELSLARAVSVTTYNNGVRQESSIDFELLSFKSNLINGSGRKIMGFETTKPYDEVEFRITKATSATLGATQVFGLYVQEFCDLPNMECNAFTSVSNPEFPAFINSKNTGINSAACGGCEVSDTQNVIDGDKSTYASIQIAAGALTSGSLSVKMGGLGDKNVIGKGNYAGFEIENIELVSAELLSVMSLTTYLNGVQQEAISGEGVLLGLSSDLIENDGRHMVGFVNQLPFDEVKIEFWSTANVSVGKTLIYDFVVSQTCPTTIDCNDTYYWSRPEFPVVLNSQRTGIQGAICVGSSVNEPDNVIEYNPNKSSRITLAAGVACTGSISVIDPSATYPTGTFVGYTIDDKYFPLQADLLEFITIRTYNDGILQEEATGVSLLDISLIIPIWGTGSRNVGFYTTKVFDEVEIEVASVASAINVIEVYGAFIDTRNSNGDTLSCSSNSTFAINDINQTPLGVPVNGNVLFNDIDDEGNNQIVTSYKADLNGDGKCDQVISVATASQIYGIDKSGNPALAGEITFDNNGDYLFSPNTSFIGEVLISYEIEDDHPTQKETDDAELLIKVIDRYRLNGSNLNISNDTNVVTPGKSIMNNILSNDSDLDGGVLNVANVKGVGVNGVRVDVSTDPNNPTSIYCKDEYNAGQYKKVGEAYLQQSSNLIDFKAEKDFYGKTTLDYLAVNSNSSESARLTITVPEFDFVNSLIANDDSSVAKKGEEHNLNLYANDNDLGGLSFKVTGLDLNGDGVLETKQFVTNGTLNVMPVINNGNSIGNISVNPLNGELTWQPNSDFIGTVVVPYQIANANGNTDNATMYLTSVPNDLVIINGVVLYDIDGLDNGDVDGDPFGPANTYALLVNASTNKVERSEKITEGVNQQDSGKFQLKGESNKQYWVQLSDKNIPLGSIVSSKAELPFGYIPTGEKIGTNVGHDNQVDGKTDLFITDKTVTEVRFGVSRVLNRVLP